MACSVAEQTGCPAGLVCEEVEGGEPSCFAPVAIQGKVLDALDGAPIVGARVLALDAGEAAVSGAVVTGLFGAYTLHVPARRDGAGKPLPAPLTLRVEAFGHQAFPLAPRTPVTIDVGAAAGDPPIVKSAATDVALVPLADVTGLGAVTGHVVVDPGVALSPAGALVVAGGATGVVDRNGDFVVHNVLAGAAVQVLGRAAGLQIAPQMVPVGAGMETAGVELHVTGAATAKVSGNVQIVNAPSSPTSVVLALKETFVEAAARGEVPKGLRAGDVSGAFEITGVPDGVYKVLATFGDDGLVRDPGWLGGSIPEVVVAGQDVFAPDVKLTGALAVVSPGAAGIEVVTGAPSFTWADDTAEDEFDVRLFDALGDEVWATVVPGASGAPDVSLAYSGPALLPGMIYQLRVTSMKSLAGGSLGLSQTEDLKGVFVYSQ